VASTIHQTLLTGFWQNNKIKDDVVIETNARGTITFATSVGRCGSNQ
jgi:hypothetical protein